MGGSLTVRLQSVFQIPVLLVLLTYMEEPLMYLIIGVLLFVRVVFALRFPSTHFYPWLTEHTRWLRHDAAFVASLIGATLAAGIAIGVAKGEVTEGSLLGLFMSAVMLVLHYVFYGNWKRRVFG